MKHPDCRVCEWCGKGFDPRRDGGKPQVFCRPGCRRAFDAAGRRWVAEAITTGRLFVHELQNTPVATRALVPPSVSTPQVGEAAPQTIPRGSKGVIQFAICQEAGIGGDHTAAKLEHQPALKIELSAPLLASPVGSAIAAPVNPPQNAEF